MILVFYFPEKNLIVPHKMHVNLSELFSILNYLPQKYNLIFTYFKTNFSDPLAISLLFHFSNQELNLNNVHINVALNDRKYFFPMF